MLASGEVQCGVTLPAMLWLGSSYVQGELRLLDEIDLCVYYNADNTQPLNAWWESLRKHYKCLKDNAIHGDIVFARRGEDLHWDKSTFMALVARGLAEAQ